MFEIPTSNRMSIRNITNRHMPNIDIDISSDFNYLAYYITQIPICISSSPVIQFQIKQIANLKPLNSFCNKQIEF